jgi:hypothetical protein
MIYNSKILTSKGYKDIQSISYQNALMDMNGGFMKADTIIECESKDMYQIDVSWRPFPIICSGEYKMYVRDKIKKWNKITKKYDVVYSHPKWIQVSELKTGSYCAMFINMKNQIPVYRGIKIELPYMWWSIGYYVGHGHLCYDIGNANSIRIKFLILNSQIFQALPRLENTFGKGEFQSLGKHNTQVTYQNSIWCNLFLGMQKRIPEWIHNAPVDSLQHFVNGYYYTDGELSTNNINFSHDIAFSIQRIIDKIRYFEKYRKKKLMDKYAWYPIVRLWKKSGIIQKSYKVITPYGICIDNVLMKY